MGTVGVGVHQTLQCIYIIEFCTDNGAMIAYAGWLRLQAGESQPADIDARARWPLDDLQRLNT